MSNQVTQGNFSQTSPPTGAIKVLYKDQNGVSNVRAVTISNVDLDGNNIKLSLDAIEQLRVFLGAQAPLTREQLNVISRASKPTTNNRDYYYLDVENLFLTNGQQISGSDSSIISITPFLTQPFFNNDYNALISNADHIRTSNFRYDVDREGGFVFPSNYEAVAGIGEMTHTDLLFEDGNGLKVKPTTTSSFAPSSNYFISESVTTPTSIKDDKDTTIRVDRASILDAIGQPAKPVVTVSEAFMQDETVSFDIESKLNIEIDNSSAFNLAGAKFQSSSLATQSNKKGNVVTTIDPFELTVASGSFNGDIFVRLKQTTKVISTSGVTVGETITQKSFLRVDDTLSDNLPVRLYFPTQEPYAPLAPVQDSNYNHTGHTNARYNGSKTSESDFSGISPAFAAKPLEAAFYRAEEDNNFICSQSLSDRDIREIFFQGETEFPEVSSQIVAYLNNPIATNSQTQIIVQGAVGADISPGDILRISTEEVLVLSVERSLFQSGLPKFTLQVERGVNSTTPLNTASPGLSIIRLSGARLLRFNKNKPVAVSNLKVWIKENRTIVKTNDRGYVVELSATCTV